MKECKGITLIALVITIIVSLILVAVVISMAVNGGLFTYARKAKIDTTNATYEEQKLADGKIQIDGKWYDSIDDYLAGNETTEELIIQGTTILLPIGYNEYSEPVTMQLEARLHTAEAEEVIPEIISCVSSDYFVAAVSETGLVTAEEAGSATITVTCSYNNKNYQNDYEVTIIQEGLAILPEEHFLEEDEPITLDYRLHIDGNEIDKSQYEVAWSYSGNTCVLSENDNSCTITLTEPDHDGYDVGVIAVTTYNNVEYTATYYFGDIYYYVPEDPPFNPFPSYDV